MKNKKEAHISVRVSPEVDKIFKMVGESFHLGKINGKSTLASYALNSMAQLLFSVMEYLKRNGIKIEEIHQVKISPSYNLPWSPLFQLRKPIINASRGANEELKALFIEDVFNDLVTMMMETKDKKQKIIDELSKVKITERGEESDE